MMLYSDMFDVVKIQKKIEINKKLVAAYKNKDFDEIKKLLLELAELDSERFKRPPFLA